MCLIIHKPAGETVPADLIRNAWEDNPDGAGLMFIDPATGQPKTYKVMGDAWTDPALHIERVLSDLTDVQVGIHFRWATHGPVCEELAHPYTVAAGAAYLMHNGVLRTGPDYTASESDTLYYIRKNLNAFRDVSAQDAELWELVGTDIGHNKFLIMDAAGQFVRVNPKLWNLYKGLYLSNTNSVPEKANYRLSAGYSRRGSSRILTAGETLSLPRHSKMEPVPLDWSDKAPTGVDRVLPNKLTRREKKVLRDCLRVGHWGPFARLGSK